MDAPTEPRHPDDALRRQLRFSLFLQGFAALMMGVAAFVRLAAFGLDALTAVFMLLCAAIVAAGVFTWTRLRAITAAQADGESGP